MLTKFFTINAILIALLLVALPGPTFHAQSALESRVVYVDGKGTLMSTKLDGTQTITIASGTHLFLAIPSTNRILYLSDMTLWSIPMGGGTPVMFSAPENAPNIDLNNWNISKDGKYVIHLTGYGLFRAPIEGGDSTALAAGLFVIRWDFTPDGKNIVFIGTVDPSVSRLMQLYVVPLAGGEPTRLNSRLTSGGNVSGLLISPDSKHVVYLADKLVDEVFQVFSVPIEGGDNITLSPDTFTVAGNMFGNSRIYAITMDGNTLIFPAQHDHTDATYSIPITGGQPVRLTTDALRIITTSSDSQSLYYATTQQQSGMDIFRVPVTGGPPIQIDSDSSSVDANSYSWEISPDRKAILAYSPYSSPSLILTEDAAQIRLASDMAGVSAMRFSPDGQTIVYWATDKAGITNLYAYDVSTGTVTVLNEFPGSKAYAIYFKEMERRGGETFLFTSDSSSVVYINDQEIEGVVDIYVVPTQGGRAVRLKSGNSNGPPRFSVGEFAQTEPAPRKAFERRSGDISAYCDTDTSGGANPHVNTGESVTIYWYWSAKTAELVNDHLKNAVYQVTVDGQPVENVQDFKTDTVFGSLWGNTSSATGVTPTPSYGDLGFNYYVFWHVPVGTLSVGQHHVGLQISWTKQITDGYDNYGPGSSHVTEKGSCTFSVR